LSLKILQFTYVIKSKFHDTSLKLRLLTIYHRIESATYPLAFLFQFLFFQRVKAGEYFIMQIILSSGLPAASTVWKLRGTGARGSLLFTKKKTCLLIFACDITNVFN
jgi:hypothetical protein